ncbi:uncharacterized protein BJ171DRAFT_511343 [Polychytrium aggregatum]|uniref:uncharacterized protein n=1 Tax=Polychytrium aggregatum TaxID=110093 RepID=UPI0022FF3563|nr:uncharacterized protein BJ171DRAFT_511343 [Polychytrium aggregatum]KAI9202942.1 hypothetical protein BJ171DRAFT_511343 [Polychytrium aggregatum]
MVLTKSLHSNLSLVHKRGIHDVVKRSTAGEIFVKQGPGGRSSVSGHVSTVFGCTGFLGRYLVNNLGKKGTQVVIPYRGNDDDKRHLKLMGDLGQIVPLRFDIRNETQIAECVRHSDVVYNLVGRDFTTKNFSFEAVHVDGARRLARIAREEGATKFIHVSALNADVNSTSAFLRSKALGEIAVREEFPEATIVRPGYMYGKEDKFWNRFGWWTKWVPGPTPIPNGGKTLLRPVYVGDVAKALAAMESDSQVAGKIVELYGPYEYRYGNLFKFFCDMAMHPHETFPVPKAVYKLFGRALDTVMVFPHITADEVERLYINDQATPGALTFKDLSIEPLSVEDTISRFVRLYRSNQFQHAPFETILKKYQTTEWRV